MIVTNKNYLPSSSIFPYYLYSIAKIEFHYYRVNYNRLSRDDLRLHFINNIHCGTAELLGTTRWAEARKDYDCG